MDRHEVGTGERQKLVLKSWLVSNRVGELLDQQISVRNRQSRIIFIAAMKSVIQASPRRLCRFPQPFKLALSVNRVILQPLDFGEAGGEFGAEGGKLVVPVSSFVAVNPR